MRWIATELAKKFIRGWKDEAIDELTINEQRALCEAVLEAQDIFQIAESGVSVKWRAIKWMEKYGEGEE